MNIFRKSSSSSSSFEIPKLCFPRQARSVDCANPSLQVPPECRGRSSSFDASNLHDASSERLQVPPSSTTIGGRSHSFDTTRTWSVGSSDENLSDKDLSDKDSHSLRIPVYQTRRASLDIPKICMHCLHLETRAKEREEQEQEARQARDDARRRRGTFYLSSESSMSSTDSDSDYTYSSDSEGSSESEEEEKVPLPRRVRKDSITSYTEAVTLHVPIIKHRSSSMDAAYLPLPQHDSPRKASLDEMVLDAPKTVRSSSVDVRLPTDDDASYKAVTNQNG